MAEKKLLVVHEDASLVEQIKTVLAATGADIDLISALSAPRALGMLGVEKPDVVIVDGELEGMDGYALTQQIKASDEGSQVAVVIISLQPSEASAMRARQVGASAHMSASGPVATLVDKVLALAGLSSNGSSSTAAPGSTLPGYGVPQQVASSAGALEASGPAPAPAPGPATAPTVAPVTAPASAPVTAPAGYGAPQAVAPASAASAPVGRSAELPGAVSEIKVGGDAPGVSDSPHIDDLLRLMIERGGSDLHITVGSPPGIRLRGEIVPVENMRALVPRDTMEMILNLLSEDQRRRFETELELDFAYSIPGVSRFRANVFQQRNSMGAVFRVIPIKIPTLEELSLPKVCRYLAERPRGLVLVTGPTGSGKSTTLAAMINHINENRALHIITLEDPIEFMHRNKKAYVNQREVGEDTHSFASALKRVLRQDPDVILVGEMRDLETIGAAITAAETGHLVLATLHTTGGPATIDRIIDVFPPHQQQQVRMQLSGTLEGVLSQVLLRSTDGRSRVMAMEVMLGIPAISNLIREGKTHQMSTIIQGGASLGMQTLDQHLKTLLQAGKVTFEEAIGKAMAPRELAQMVGRKI